MSNFLTQCRDKVTGEVHPVTCLDNYFGYGQYGYRSGFQTLTQEDFDSRYEIIKEHIQKTPEIIHDSETCIENDHIAEPSKMVNLSDPVYLVFKEYYQSHPERFPGGIAASTLQELAALAAQECPTCKGTTGVKHPQQIGQGWLDISAAPRDGTHVLVTDGHEVGEVYWHRNRWFVYVAADAYFNEQWGDSNGEPTHYMPLPKPPQQTEGGV